MHQLHLSGPGPWTLDLFPPIPLRSAAAGPFRSHQQPEPGAVSRRRPSQVARGDLAVRHDLPESADTDTFRSDGGGIDLVDEKGVVMIMSDYRRSAMHGPRLPAGTAETGGRGGSRRGAG
jgi:hypothetical protein